jgi:nucleotide-binding universal stress UspA family protein
MKQVLVALSGNSIDDKLIEIACDIARKHKAAIHLIHVIKVARSLPLDADLESELNRVKEIISLKEKTVEDEDLEVESDIIQAREVGPAIVNVAHEKSSNLIVVGLNHKRQIGEFTTGEVASYILKNSPCPVVVYRG